MNTAIIISSLKPETIEKHKRLQGNEQEKAIDALLKSNGISYSVFYRGENKNSDNWVSDGWIVGFEKKGQKVDFEYYTGIGHRYLIKSSTWGKPTDAFGRKRWKEENSQPVSPFAACVLYGIVADSVACDMSFDEWCENYGYGTDSRKALGTYLACQANGNKLHKFFGTSLLNDIAAILEDY